MNEALYKTFGPWAVMAGVMWLMLKFLVTDKLKTIMAKLDKVDEHEVKLAEIKLAMEINGCMAAHPACGRRKEDRESAR